jgi:hypothetical protein
MVSLPAHPTHWLCLVVLWRFLWRVAAVCSRLWVPVATPSPYCPARLSNLVRPLARCTALIPTPHLCLCLFFFLLTAEPAHPLLTPLLEWCMELFHLVFYRQLFLSVSSWGEFTIAFCPVGVRILVAGLLLLSC